MHPTIARTLEVTSAVVREVRAERLTFVAGSVAYHAFVSLLPLLVLLLTVVSLVGDASLQESLLALTRSVLTPGTDDEFVAQLRAASRSTSVSVLGFVVLLWGTLRIFRGIDTAFSAIYESSAENTLADQLRDGVLVLGAFTAAIVAASVVEAAFPADGGAALSALRALLLLVGLALTLFPLYYVFPDVDVSAVEVLPGTAFVAVGLTVLSTAFRWYAGPGDSNLVVNVLLLMTWLYASGFVLLLGAAVNAVLADRSRDVSIDPVVGDPRGRDGGRDDGACDGASERLRERVGRLEERLGRDDPITVSIGGDAVTLDPPSRAVVRWHASVEGGETATLELRWEIPEGSGGRRGAEDERGGAEDERRGAEDERRGGDERNERGGRGSYSSR
ncbi:YhjD/YihY/BrkB family envelope integrity protein [Halomarina pelagica]|uniref:YhjD/YihY/BrkB family envelope integrity protein n=1 Tax=Halomarina pelagica TaxID=2961599 RepID=UPI0020C42AC9|nr:YhjD/YihY/BrkB family envelope integrity protein [Halomarina sp. BND7]